MIRLIKIDRCPSIFLLWKQMQIRPIAGTAGPGEQDDQPPR